MKAFAAVLAVATASTMSLTAFADVSVGTTYNTSDSKVESTVSGVTSGDMVAYVVYDSSKAITDEGAIKFIDQKTATGDSVTFSFSAVEAGIWTATGHTVKVGTSAVANSPALTNELQLKTGKVTYKVGEHGKVLAQDSAAFATGDGNEIADLSSVSFRVFPDAGYKLKEIKKDSETSTNTATDGVYTFTITKDTSFEFIFETISSTSTATITEPSNTEQVNKLTKESESTSAVTYAKVDNGKYDEIGFAFSSDSSKITSSTTTKVDGVEYFSALGVGTDGSFAIQLNEKAEEGVEWSEADKFLQDTMYAWSYVKSGDTYTYGNMITLNTFAD